MRTARILAPLCLLILTIGFHGCSSDQPVTLSTVAPPDFQPVPEFNEVATDQLVASGNTCLLLADEAASQLPTVAADHGLQVLESFGGGRLALVSGSVDAIALSDDPRVVAFQQDGFTALSSPVELTMSFYEGDLGGGVPAQSALTSLRLSQVHAMARGNGVKIAVLDTGVDPTHPLLQDKLSMIPANSSYLVSQEAATGVDTDGDGVVDEAFGHGTHVSGLVSSVAPGAEILPIRVLDSDGVGSAFELAMGLLYAADHRVQIINLSLVLSDETQVIEKVLRDVTDRGIVVVGSAGNHPGSVQFPASDSHVTGVAALDGPALAAFSAAEGARLAAPGQSVVSAYPGGLWYTGTGTSMSSAIVSGAVAVLTELTGSAARAEELLRDTAIPIHELQSGEIDLLHAAREALRARTAPPDRFQHLAECPHQR